MCMSLRREDKEKRGEVSLFPPNRKGQHSEDEQICPISSDDIIRRIKFHLECPGESSTIAHSLL